MNHRYLDVNIRMPKKLNFFETAIRTLLKQYANRGKVDIFISCEDLSQQQMMLKYNAALAAEYMRYFRQMSEEFHITNDVKVSALSHYPEVLTMEEQTEDEEILERAQRGAGGAFGQFVETRVLEGSHLKKISFRSSPVWNHLWNRWKHVLLRLWQSIVQSWKKK